MSARVPAVGSVLAAVVVAVLAVGGPTPVRLAVLAAFVLAVGVLVLFAHNQLVFRVTGFVVAGLPLVPAPGLGAPLVLVLGIGVWVALVTAVRPRLRVGWVEVLVAATVVVAGISVVATGPDGTSIVEYGRWVIAFTLVVPLRALATAELVSFGRAFVAGATFGAVGGIALLLADRQGLFLSRLAALGYDPDGGNVRIVAGSTTSSLRLTSTYVDPNMGGLILAVGLVLAVALLRGAPRVAVAGAIGLAILLTLSRTSIATVAVALLVLLVAARVAPRTRALVGAGIVATTVVTLSIGSVRARLLDSFGPTDTGTQARLASLGDYADAVSGHWWWGLGWGIEEFRDAGLSYATNYVANAPLLTVYRAGVLVGLLFVAILVAGSVRSLRLLRRGSFPAAVVGAGFLATALVALQLDFPVALLPPATMAFAVLLAFVTRDDWHDDQPDVVAAGAEPAALDPVGSR